MTPDLRILLRKSFEVIPGEFYNQYRQDVQEQSHKSYLFYEIALTEEKSWQFIRDREYPLFVRYIKTKGLDPAMPRGLIVAIFHIDRCYLLKGKDFLKAYLDLEGIDPAKFLQKIQQWLSV